MTKLTLRLFMSFLSIIFVGCASTKLATIHSDRAPANDNAGAQESGRINIKVNAAYAANSLWTEAEIRQRFEYTSSVYMSTCKNVSIELSEIVRIDDVDLQDINGYQTESSVNQRNSILSRFKVDRRPTIFYVRKAVSQEEQELSEGMAKAFILGGPRSLPQFQTYTWNDGYVFDAKDEIPFIQGNLNWDQSKKLRPLHGTIVLTQSSSQAHRFNLGRSRNHAFTVDSHELGHVLLNDPGHRNHSSNIMSSAHDATRTYLDEQQCALIRSYYAQESLRNLAIQDGMRQICSYTQKLNVPIEQRPQYCAYVK